MIVISDINDERISFYRSLRFTPKLHSDNRAFIAEEEKVVVTLLKSDVKVLSIFATEEFFERYADLINKKSIPADQTFMADRSLMRQIVGYGLHSGFLAIGRQPEDTPLQDMELPLICFNALANAENAGSIVRNAAAFGFKSIIYDQESVSPYLRRAVRVSMGNILYIGIHHTPSIIDTIKMLKESGCKIVAVEITPESIPHTEFKPEDKNYCLIFGSEGRGISEEVLNLCDLVIHIPISDKLPSLNVASSSAIILNTFSQL